MEIKFIHLNNFLSIFKLLEKDELCNLLHITSYLNIWLIG